MANNKIIDKEVTDLGLGYKDVPKTIRIINQDGSFNMVKTGLSRLDSFSFYHFLVNIGWIKFILIVTAGYVAISMIFGLAYYLIGVQHLSGVIADDELHRLLESFFFSAQSFTTVGYGRISPVGFWTSSVAALESLIGLLALALATGLLYGRFSRPVANILFSENALVSPFKEINGLMFRMVNKQKSNMYDVEARIIYSPLEINNGAPIRKYYRLKLEYDKINFFPSVWTVNHPIDESSPLFGKSSQDFENEHVEFMILVQGFDESFNEVVHSRFSYSFTEIVWGAKFVNVYGLESDGKTTIAVDKLNDYDIVKLNLNLQ